MTRRFLLMMCALVASVAPASASDGTGQSSLATVRHFSASIETLVRQVSPSVVQVLVTGYGPLESSGNGDADLVIGRQRSIGSGVIVDPEGYIVTNAHVVSGGRRIEVVLADDRTDSPIHSLTSARGETVEARVVGVAREVDLALLKVERKKLRAIPLADYDSLRTGQLVFAFGSPEGLRNSVTMGVVSAVARQPDPDHPMVYIQTDAPINRGNSGGPLVNAGGELVGINTFMLSDSGGSEGLGFAIPSAVVNVTVEQLRRYGHLHRGELGLDVQTITPDLARGLGLARNRGLIVSDVAGGGPAERAGLKPEDVIVGVDGAPMDTTVELAFHLYTRGAEDHVRLDVLRGRKQTVVDVPIVERAHDLDRLADRVDPERNLVRQLGILGVAIDGEIGQMLTALRLPFGVIVAARAQDSGASDVALSAGDIIHAVNGIAIATLDDLRSALNALQARSPVVLQVERDGKLSFVTFELD